MLFENFALGSDRNSYQFSPLSAYMSCALSLIRNRIASDLARVTYDIVPLDAIRFAPRAHDPSIIESDNGDDVDALGLDLR